MIPSCSKAIQNGRRTIKKIYQKVKQNNRKFSEIKETCITTLFEYTQNKQSKHFSEAFPTRLGQPPHMDVSLL